ncbi:MAG: transposase, partial [Candidatus Hodarchaeales archaeon]
MLFLQRWHPASDRKVEERAFMDISYRFFLKLPFPAPVPDATTLSRYRTLWGDDKIKQVFKNIYRQIQSHGFARVRPGLVGDTTHQHASIQKPTARQLLLDGFVKFINAFVQLGDRYSMFFNQARI